MEKVALCTKNLDDIVKLVKDEVSSIELSLVPRTVCENPENGYLQLIPYVAFATLDVESGKIKFLQYARSGDINEQRLASKTSIGFGGHIDNLEDIEYTKKNEDTFTLTKENLFKTLTNTAKREIKEELNIDLDSLTIETQRDIFFMGDPEEDVNKVHLAYAVVYFVDEKTFDTLVENKEFNKEEVAEISNLTINFGSIVEEFNLDTTLNRLFSSLKNDYLLEDWSARLVAITVDKVTKSLVRPITYSDIYSLIESKENNS